MVDKVPNKFFVTKSSRLIVGEVTNVLRAQGNISSTGTSIDASSDSPIVNGKYGIIPQMSIGMMDYQDFNYASKEFKKTEENITNESDHPWNSIGAVSLDAIFCPYTTMADSGRSGPWLPRFTEAASGVTGPSSKTLNPFNPFNNLSGISPTGHSVNSDPWMSGGHSISMALNYNPYDSGVSGSGGFVGISGTYPGGTGSPVENNFEKDHFVRHTVETEGIRAVGLRSPLILSGWGYDTNGSPVPSGNAIINGVSGVHPEIAWNPSVWKSGPVDLRWNENRGVWSAAGGGGGKMIFFTIQSVEYCSSCYVVANIRSWSSSYASKSDIENIGVGVYFESDPDVGSDQILVYDRGGCFFNEPPEDLIGREGFATLMYHEGTGPCSELGDPRNQPLWTVLSLCCPTDECS